MHRKKGFSVWFVIIGVIGVGKRFSDDPMVTCTTEQAGVLGTELFRRFDVYH